MKFVRSSTPHPARPHRSASVRLSDTIRPHPPRFKRSPVQLTLRHHTPMAAVLRRRPSPSPFVTFPSKPPFWSLPAEEFDREVDELDPRTVSEQGDNVRRAVFIAITTPSNSDGCRAAPPSIAITVRHFPVEAAFLVAPCGRA